MIAPMKNKTCTNSTVFRALRTAKGLSYRELARRAGCDPSQVARIEAGTSLPRVDLAIRLASILRGRVETLWPPAEAA